MATISKNQKLLLKIDIPQKDFAKIGVIKTANFKINDQLYTTNQLNGRVVSYGKNTPTGSPFIPFYFEIDNKGNFISGSVIEVFLQTGTKSALTIPLSSLVEEQGIFYTYVQTEGESFQKRELKIGSSDGLNVEVLSGISVG